MAVPPNVTQLDIVNQAILYLGNNQAAVTGSYPNFDNSPAGVAAKNLYGPCVQTVMRQYGWDFGRANDTLTASGNTAPFPWSHEYLYPDDGIEIRQVLPASLTDTNNPTPILWTVGNVDVAAVPTKVIWTNEASAKVVYSNFPPPSTWDAGFREAVVRLLASEMAMAVSGKPDTSEKLTESAGAFEGAAETRNG